MQYIGLRLLLRISSIVRALRAILVSYKSSWAMTERYVVRTLLLLLERCESLSGLM
jgi:hypothetical protein